MINLKLTKSRKFRDSANTAKRTGQKELPAAVTTASSSITISTTITTIATTATAIPVTPTTTAATVTVAATPITASSEARFGAPFAMRNFHLDLLTVHGGAIQFFDGISSISFIGHGDKGVTLASVENVGDPAKFVEFAIQKIARARTTHAVDKKFDSVAVVAHVAFLLRVGSVGSM